MRARLLPALLSAALAAAVLVPHPTSAAPAGAQARTALTVRVEHLMYLPGTVKGLIGAKVTWFFPEMSPHTTTSGQGFWDSGSRSSGESYVRIFSSAGSYPYHCTLHPSMQGVVKVGLTVTAPSATERVVRWSTVKGTGVTTFDVQRRIGSRPWKAFRTDTVRPKAVVRPTSGDLVKFRARTSTGDAVSGWSRPATVRFG